MSQREPRSFLFVPGDSEKKLAKGTDSGADALILDLEDSVVASRRSVARGLVLEYLRAHPAPRRQALWVRVNPLSEAAVCLADLAAVVAGAPDGLYLPKTHSAQEVVLLDHYLTALEARESVPPGTVRIIPVATETAAAVLTLASYRGSSLRLAGLTWGAEDLAAAIGAASNLDENGEYDFTYRMARSLCLLAAHAAGVQAIETITVDFRDDARLRREVREARRAGFTGKMAIHPNQVGPINEGFSPDAGELAHAQAIVAAFESDPQAGTLQVDGKMIDRPHLVQAMKVLARARR